MRDGKTNFKGKFYVGQKVRIDVQTFLQEQLKGIEIYCMTGIIKNVKGKFLHTPSLTEIQYEIEMDKEKWSNIGGPGILIVSGELLTPLEE